MHENADNLPKERVLPPERLHNWAALLSFWTALAQAAGARDSAGRPDGGSDSGPDVDGAGPSKPDWRRAVPSMIALHAATCALEEIDLLEDGSAESRGLAIDRASVLIAKHIREVNALYRGHFMPARLEALIASARKTIHAAEHSGTAIVLEQSATMRPGGHAEIVARLGPQFAGTLWLLAEGAAAGEGCPVGFVRAPRGGGDQAASAIVLNSMVGGVMQATGGQELPVTARLSVVADALQVYRAWPNQQQPPIDMVALFDAELHAGLPLLVPVLERGVRSVQGNAAFGAASQVTGGASGATSVLLTAGTVVWPVAGEHE